ncbi:4256_t:CDS:1, partial [Dentiscutata heterogama]
MQEHAQYNYCDYKYNESVVRCEGHLRVCDYAVLETKQQYFGSIFQEPEKKP